MTHNVGTQTSDGVLTFGLWLSQSMDRTCQKKQKWHKIVHAR